MHARDPLQVLIVADDEAVRDAVAFALRLEGFGVRAHPLESGLLADPALDAAACIVIDDRKPRVDGFGLISRVRERGVRAPAVLVAGYVTPKLRQRAMAAGFQAVLEKPLLSNSLLEAIRLVVTAADHDDTRSREVVRCP